MAMGAPMKKGIDTALGSGTNFLYGRGTTKSCGHTWAVIPTVVNTYSACVQYALDWSLQSEDDTWCTKPAMGLRLYLEEVYEHSRAHEQARDA